MIVLEFRYRKQAKPKILVIFESGKSSVKFSGFVVENYIGHRSIEMYERKMNLRHSIENEKCCNSDKKRNDKPGMFGMRKRSVNKVQTDFEEACAKQKQTDRIQSDRNSLGINNGEETANDRERGQGGCDVAPK